MRWQSWPESALNPPTSRVPRDPMRWKRWPVRYVRNRMISGEPIRDENLLPATAGSPSAMRLLRASAPWPCELRRITLPAVSSCQYDRVDVLLTVTPTATTPRQGATTSTTRTSNEGQIVYTRTLLRNVPVLAIDWLPSHRRRAGARTRRQSEGVFIGATATLELDPRQAEILAAGEATGTISLALRSEKDNGEKPPITRMQSSSSQSVSSSMVGTMKIYHITTSNTPVEITEPAMPLGPAWAPPQETMPPEQHQVQRGGSGFAVVKQGDTGAAIR